MGSSSDFKAVQGQIQAALVATTRTANQLAAEDLSFHRSSNPTVDEQLDEASERLLTLSSELLKSATKTTDLKAPELEDADDVEVHWSRIVDVIDTLLEKADTCLDEYTGLVKRKAAPTEEAGTQPKKAKTFTALDASMRRANILKPQNVFEVKPDNTSTSPWKPILTKKPHATVPFAQSLNTFNNEADSTQYDYSIFFPRAFENPDYLPQPDTSVQGVERRVKRHKAKKRRLWREMTTTWNTNSEFRYKHPYETEILQLKYPEAMYEAKEPIKYQPVESTTATFVDTFEGVLDMLAELKQADVIAIDTEHHDFRTYYGLLSLMQISTREKDWIVDTLQPWRHKLEVLNEVFTDPKIVKVLHGAYMDILWLQRDLGLYVVGLFDTFHAAESLQYTSKSLAYLLKRFVDFDADKKYQLADWRLRPIPEEMFYYARSDTHFLLYIFDLIRNELLARSNRSRPDEDHMTHVLEKSKETSLRRHERIVYDTASGQGPNGWYNMLIKSSGNLTREQFAVFRAVHKWRDDLARREDESPMFIFSNSAIFDIARRLPPDPKALFSILGFPSSHASHVAKTGLTDLFKVIAKAKEEGETGPTLSDFFRGSTIGIGEVAKQVFPNLGTASSGVLDTKDLVSEQSKLWGGVPVGSRWENTSSANAAADGLRFALPWAAFMENASLDETSGESLAVRSRKEPAQAQPTNEPMEDTEFTLKAGKKRKAPEPEGDEESAAGTSNPTTSGLDGDEIALDDSERELEQQDAERKARKAQKKAEKAAKKAVKAAEKDTEIEDEQLPFDYSTAKSVLKKQRNGDANGGKGKVFNPYKSLNADGPKPARRMHGEKPGKSATFKKV
ncbi:exosome complex exonuclease rrp protein [Apiospora kogelbergensis]|uniref:Exosome complex exonuclease rrp protein n=1 Tax=Apiospora kogelbergensis TaxID=1337665 RepID=A0AAW0QQT5_9PEZI